MPEQSRSGGYAAFYHRRVLDLLRHLAAEQQPAIEVAAELVASSWRQGGRTLIAATGHCLHLEGTYRAGGPVDAAILALGDEPPGALQVNDVRVADCVIVPTNAGTTSDTVEVALRSRTAGATVVALTQLPYENDPAIASEHASGAKLAEVADVVIDLGGDVGDGAIAIPGSMFRIAPTSSAVGVVALWMIFAAAAESLVEEGLTPRFYASVQLPGASEHNSKLAAVRSTPGEELKRD